MYVAFRTFQLCCVAERISVTYRLSLGCRTQFKFSEQSGTNTIIYYGRLSALHFPYTYPPDHRPLDLGRKVSRGIISLRRVKKIKSPNGEGMKVKIIEWDFLSLEYFCNLPVKSLKIQDQIFGFIIIFCYLWKTNKNGNRVS